MEETRIQRVFGDERNMDPFRLGIIGFTMIEEALDERLAQAFDGELPHELRRTPFNLRVSLAEALGLLPPTFKGPLGRLKKIRDDFAQGKLTGRSTNC